MSAARQKPVRVPTHIRPADTARVEKLRRLLSAEMGIATLPDADVLSKALQIALDHYKERAKTKK